MFLLSSSSLVLVFFLVRFSVFETFSIQSTGEVIRYCLKTTNILRCLKLHIIAKLDKAIQDNSTWHLNKYISLEKDVNWQSDVAAPNNSVSRDLKLKIMDLMESRSLKVKVSRLMQDEGRKKKYKGDKGGYAMMGGMAMMGLMAQMIIGKLLLLAGGAFILAKIALLYSILSGLKKSGGSNTDHVIYADTGSSNGGHGSGWHRSISPYHSYNLQKGHYSEEYTPEP